MSFKTGCQEHHHHYILRVLRATSHTMAKGKKQKGASEEAAPCMATVTDEQLRKYFLGDTQWASADSSTQSTINTNSSPQSNHTNSSPQSNHQLQVARDKEDGSTSSSPHLPLAMPSQSSGIALGSAPGYPVLEPSASPKQRSPGIGANTHHRVNHNGKGKVHHRDTCPHAICSVCAMLR